MNFHEGEGLADAAQRLHRVFRFKGWAALCRSCGRWQAVHKQDRGIEHQPDCLTPSERHPWVRLRMILNGDLPDVSTWGVPQPGVKGGSENPSI